MKCKCSICGRSFVAEAHNAKYCPACRKEMKNKNSKECRKRQRFMKSKPEPVNIGQCRSCLYRLTNGQNVIGCGYLFYKGVSRLKINAGSPPNCLAYEKTTKKKREELIRKETEIAIVKRNQDEYSLILAERKNKMR